MIGMMPFFRTRPPTNALENATESIPRLLHCRLHDLNWFHFFRLHFFRLHFMAFIAFNDSPQKKVLRVVDRRAFTLSASDASWASGAFCEPFTLYGWIGLDFGLSTHGKACWIPSQLCQLSSDDSLCCTSSRYECEVVSFSELQGTGAQWD